MKIHGLFIFVATAAMILSVIPSSAADDPDDTLGARKMCTDSEHCNHDEKCLSNQCRNVCSESINGVVQQMKKCGQNADCYTIEPHIAACKCRHTHRGNPDQGCFERKNFYHKPGHF